MMFISVFYKINDAGEKCGIVGQSVNILWSEKKKKHHVVAQLSKFE